MKAQQDIDLSMGASYANQVYFKLSNLTTTSYPGSVWDLAFLRTGQDDIGIRINDHAGIKVYEVTTNTNAWDDIPVTTEAQSEWTQLYNSETTWTGAFDNGSATYGFGEYNPDNQHIEGSVIFVLKYADGTYRKFLNQDAFNGYTFKYATWNTSTNAWGEDTTVTLENTNNPNNTYNFYSLETGEEVYAQPATTDWDFVATKYISDYNGNGSLFWPVTGVLHNDQVTVAQNEEMEGATENPTLTYSDEINTIGSDWKTYVSSVEYDVNSDMAYYVKYADNSVYRIYFTAFEGSSTGNLSFAFENVTQSLGVEELDNNVTFGVYPNPSSDGKINLIYDVAKSGTNHLTIYSMQGSKILETSLSSQQGFYNKTLDLSHLQKGVYMLNFTSGDYTISKKVILK
ncbi:T9SS type A sorting domain-containing protein [Mangrovimonas sp. TPBH4]|uniref:T9SS type A sorting domain-containing protein n=1 Tax=Mangrovimonas sp. TPBH4 TaxID=1645914 RepID=UPI0006B467BC|nr:T9SS type A sorting domain-containing protein [Mangrovimonas sp. TPBH4]